MVQPLIDCMLRVIGRLAVRAVELPVDVFSLATEQITFSGTLALNRAWQLLWQRFRGGA